MEYKKLARLISIVENEAEGYYKILEELPEGNTPVIGITGAPGSGKSTLVDRLIQIAVDSNKKVSVLSIDPSSIIHSGALLGDRIRMQQWYMHPSVFIRSLGSRGASGGLNPKIIELTDLMRSQDFDLIFLETVGVGQTEIEISMLADKTILLLVPEGGDDIQLMKSGIMESADLYVLNKSDRPGASQFYAALRGSLEMTSAMRGRKVLQTIATEGAGIPELFQEILTQPTSTQSGKRNNQLLASKAYYLIREHAMKPFSRSRLEDMIDDEMESSDFNLYRFVKKILVT
jgi:LAO/AO transport system kinase